VGFGVGVAAGSHVYFQLLPEHGVLAHRSKCTYYKKNAIKMYFKMLKKLGKKSLVYI
jgi:hypothetical protein